PTSAVVSTGARARSARAETISGIRTRAMGSRTRNVADRAHLGDADRIPARAAAIAVLAADLRHARVAAGLELGARGAFGVRARAAAAAAASTAAGADAARAAALTADRRDFADADAVPRARAAVAVDGAHLGRARIAARDELRTGLAGIVRASASPAAAPATTAAATAASATTPSPAASAPP